MKATFIGGGAHRLLGILRGAMSDPRLFDGGAITLYDLDIARAKVMAEMLKRTPEYAQISCRIDAAGTMEEALDGADSVGVIMPAGSQASAMLGDEVSWRHGFISSDNVSPNGAMHALKAGPTILRIARAMEERCPNAWLIDFVNPVAVFSGMVNNHTRVKALGVCAGFTNHQWDIGRILGADRQETDISVDVAGINHLSFILRGTVQGDELFRRIDKAITGDWKMPPVQAHRSETYRQMVTRSVTNLIKIYRELGVLIFSTEGDGMQHLFYDQAVKEFQARPQPPTGAALAETVAAGREARQAQNEDFAAHLDRDLNKAFWDNADELGTLYGRVSEDIFVRVMRGIAGLEKVNIVTSRPNRGAVAGFDDRTVIEYSQYLENGQISPAEKLYVPAVVQGMISGIAAHQTMLGDAIATSDPRLLAHALLAYPWLPYSQASRALHRELLEANQPDIQPELRHAVEYLAPVTFA
jgi:alpha-galactosidase/6-phospho-beta-glucosidase family protein